jgi:hypothetical protein
MHKRELYSYIISQLILSFYFIDYSEFLYIKYSYSLLELFSYPRSLNAMNW